ADRYQDRPFPAHDDYGRGTDQHGQTADSDPLAELARLIGQTDPFAMGRGNAKAQPQAAQRYQAPQEQQYEPEPYEQDTYAQDSAGRGGDRRGGPPQGTRREKARVQQREPPQPQYDDDADYQPAPVHPLHRYGAPQQAAPPPPPLPQAQTHYQYEEEPQQYAE